LQLHSLYRCLSFITVLYATAADAYTNMPALVNLNINRQSDSMGFNMVYELQNHCYKHIMAGTLKLWDSPQKSIRISPSALQAIEQSSDTRFNKTANVFLHEFWSSGRKKTTFTIVGISFINDGSKGKVSYGYIDLRESWNVLASIFLECNVNGPSRIRMTEALYSRNYNFNVVQFGRQTFTKNPEKAIRIRDKAFYSTRNIEGLFTIPQSKEVYYKIVAHSDDPDDPGNMMMANMQRFLNDNKDVLFNLGADKYYDYKTLRTDVVVTGIDFHEEWKLLSSGIRYDVKSVVIYINNKPLNAVTADEIYNWGLLYRYKTIEDLIQEKSYDFVLTRINSTLIPEWDSHKYLKALSVYNWSQVSRYVQFY
jgi:hypothetical protein